MTPPLPGSREDTPRPEQPRTPVADPLARFARAHLRTPAERAVYQTIGSDPASWWTPQEIAARTGLDRAEVDQALRGFAAANILDERTHPTDGRRYRWHSELLYVFEGTAPPADMIDPVCGMPVTADSPHHDHDPTGGAVYFCSPHCRAAYRSRQRRR